MDPDPRTKVSYSRSCRIRVPTSLARSAFQRALAEHGLSGRVSVLWTDDEGIRELNARFRGRDEPTDVLTFPGPDFPGAPLGDVAISLETARRQAAARGIPPETETAYLAIHAALHLAGGAQLVGHIHGHINRNGKRNAHKAAAAAVDLRIDAHHLPS